MPEKIVLPLHQDNSSLTTAFVLRGFFSKQECQHFISLAEEEATNLQPCGYRPSIRQTDRYEMKSDQVAYMLLQRVLPYLQECISLDPQTGDWPVGIPPHVDPGEWTPSHVNQPLRICRYEKGGFFVPHHDGAVVKNDSERSFRTIMVYLNDNYTGGATNFYSAKQKLYAAGQKEHCIHSFRPQTGDALIFFGNIAHEGEVLSAGKKYILRSEIMYKRKMNQVGVVKPDHEEELVYDPDTDGGRDTIDEDW